MENEQAEVVWLDERARFSLAELARCCSLSEAELLELVDYGVLTPCDTRDAEWTFSGDIALTAQAAGRLRDDLELDAQTLALTLTLINRIRRLEAQIRSLHAQLPHRHP
jgi:chaperone modulatory protein CbpM